MRIFKKIILWTAVAAAFSCAKLNTDEGTNVAAKRAFDAWMSVNHPDVEATGAGIYILSDEEGIGEEITADNFVFWEIEKRTLDSTIVYYNTEASAILLNKYSPSYDFGATASEYAQGTMSAGEMQILSGDADKYKPMRIGGRRTAVVPGWLSSTSKYYNKAEDYLSNVTGENYIYNIKVVGQTEDIIQWQIDSIMKTKLIQPKDYVMTKADSLESHKGNLFLKRNIQREIQRGVEVLEDYNFPSDTTIYINYIGRLLNGKVFDTNIADTAKMYKIWSSSRSYKPVSVSFASDSTALQMSGSSVIKGFSLALWHMHPYESATAVMTSDYAYTYLKKDEIRPYSSLIFELDIVDEP